MAHPIVAKLEDVIGDVGAWSNLPARRAARKSISRPMTTRRSSIRRAPRANPKARSARIAIPAPRSSRAPVFDCARLRATRGTPPQPDPAAPQKSSLVSIPFFHITGCQAGDDPGVLRWREIGLDAQMGPGKRARADRARTRHFGRRRSDDRLAAPRASRSDRIDLCSLEGISYGGAPAAAELVRRIKQVCPKSAPGTGWGMTETSATFTHLRAKTMNCVPIAAAPRCLSARCASSGRTASLPRPANRRTLGARPQCRQGLLAQSRGDRADVRRRLAAHWRRRPRSTTKASARSSTAPRTC